MPNFNGVNKYTVNTGGTVNLDVTQSTVTRYIFSGTSTLSSGYTISPTGTAIEGMEFDIRWQAVVNTGGGNVVTVFGTALTATQALNDLIITCYYNGSAWDVDIQQDNGVSCTNGLGFISGSVGLGGTLTQDTIVTSTSSNTLQLVHTAGSANGNDVTFTMGEGAPGVTANGISFLSSSTDIFGSISRVTNAGVDELLVSFSDISESVTNGLKVVPTNFSLRAYDPTGSSKIGYSGYDGTEGFDHAANMFFNDVALDLDISHVQCTETQVLSRFAYNTTPSSEEYNRIIINEEGITMEATGGIADDKFISVIGYLQNFANDAAAAAGGVPVGALYRNGSVVMIRVA